MSDKVVCLQVDTGRECSRIDFSISHQGKYVILAGDVDCLSESVYSTGY